MNTKDDWENLKFFIALAKEKQLKRAADALKSNHTTVYRRISQFEEKYNLRLFERTPAGYYLTSQGEALYEQVESLEGAMDAVFSSLQGLENTLKGSICITTTPSFAVSLLPAMIKKFQLQWPDITIDLRVSHQIYNLSKREADIAIRPATDVPLHLIGRRAGYLNYAVFKSAKNYERDINKKQFMQEIKQHRFIVMSEELAHLPTTKWLNKHIEENNVACRVDGFMPSAELCAKGVGLAILPLYCAKQDKSLELVHKPEENIGDDVWVLTHKNLSRVPKIKVCTEFFYRELQGVLV